MADDIIAKLKEQFPGTTDREFRGQRRIDVAPDANFQVLTALQDSGFNLLVDITCVDYLQYRSGSRDSEPAARFGLTYLLANVTTAARMTVRAYLDDGDQPTIATVVPLWEGANWLEREVFDMFGIHFEGHPNLRRILMPEEFTAHPLRKDYPLQGRGERHNFPVIARGQA